MAGGTPQLRKLTGVGRASMRSVFLSQLPMAGATAFVTIGIAVFAPRLLTSSSFVVSVVLVLGATVIAIAVPWYRIDSLWVAAIPLIDIAAIGFMGALGPAIQLSILLVLPVIWLASMLQVWGAVVGTVSGTVASWGTSLLGPGPFTMSNASRELVVPLVLALVGATMAGTSIRAAAQRDMLTRQSHIVEESLENAKRQRRVLDGILNAVDFGIIAVDARGRRAVINRSSAVRLGVQADADLTDLRFYGPDRVTPLPDAAHPLDRANAGETFAHELMWFGNPDGEQVALIASGQQIRDEHGSRTGAVVVFQDVTDEVEAIRSREELVAAVSHELRTPLTSIVGYLELALDDPDLTDGARSYTRIAAQNADRMLHLISDLLVASSIAEGKLDIVPTMVDIAAIVSEAVEAQLPRAREAGQSVECAVAPDGHLPVDELRIRQVIDNVLSNAVKYGKPGGTVRIESEWTGSDFRVIVSDDGIGIAQADQEKLFNRFYRASAVRGSSIGGTGLGLSISKAIMREHGGDLVVESELGAGTRVSIILPLPSPAVGPAS